MFIFYLLGIQFQIASSITTVAYYKISRIKDFTSAPPNFLNCSYGNPIFI